ncbi:MAG: MFS transporter [Cyanophyceae cyanobacterium]|mgnify:CR=1 FL=1
MSNPAFSGSNNKPPQPLSLSTKLAYGAGDLGPAITANVLIFFLLFFLTEVAGLSPGLAGWILLIGKVGDAINDPIIGVMSDRTRSKWGRRYPWMIGGAIPFGVFFLMQWWIPFQDEWALFWYYLVIATLFNLAYTAVSLPYAALTPQLSDDYNERTNLNTFRFAFSIGGSIASLVVAQLIFQSVDDLVQRYLILGAICTAASIIPIFLCVAGTFRRAMPKERILMAQEAAGETTEAPLPLVKQIGIALGNRPFQYVVGIYLCSWFAVQLIGAIMQFYVVSWMRLDAAEFPNVALAVQGTAIAFLPIWGRLSKTKGKRGVYFMGMGIWLIAQVGLLFLQPGQVGLMYFLCVMAGAGVSTAYLVPWSMLPDVIDADELKTGQRREGVFYSFMVFLQKMGLALALWFVGQIIEWAGYIKSVPDAPPPVQPESALWAIRLLIGPLPAIALVAGIILTYFYPITAELHREILLKLQERKEKSGELS